MLANKRPDLIVPAAAWDKPWVVISTIGARVTAVLRYLARYVFRVTITNTRIVALDDPPSLSATSSANHRWRTCRLHGDEFDRRFLQHVLPKGFHKVRYFGLAPTADQIIFLPVFSKPSTDLHCRERRGLIGGNGFWRLARWAKT